MKIKSNWAPNFVKKKPNPRVFKKNLKSTLRIFVVYLEKAP